MKTAVKGHAEGLSDPQINNQLSRPVRLFFWLPTLAPRAAGRYLGPSLASFFLISGLSYKTTFNRELRISNLPLYSI
jgi:hypothetical protein